MNETGTGRRKARRTEPELLQADKKKKKPPMPSHPGGMKTRSQLKPRRSKRNLKFLDDSKIRGLKRHVKKIWDSKEEAEGSVNLLTAPLEVRTRNMVLDGPRDGDLREGIHRKITSTVRSSHNRCQTEKARRRTWLESPSLPMACHLSTCTWCTREITGDRHLI